MTAKRLTYVYCDHPDCEGESPFSTDVCPEEPAWFQRTLFKNRGWVYRKGKDYCEKHAAEISHDSNT